MVVMQIGTAIMENSMEASKEIENRTTLSYSRASSGYIPK
jgi:hypothetical protein